MSFGRTLIRNLFPHDLTEPARLLSTQARRTIEESELSSALGRRTSVQWEIAGALTSAFSKATERGEEK